MKKKKKRSKSKNSRVPTSREELGLNYKRGDKVRWRDSLRGVSPGLSPGCCMIGRKSLPMCMWTSHLGCDSFPFPLGTEPSVVSTDTPSTTLRSRRCEHGGFSNLI